MSRHDQLWAPWRLSYVSGSAEEQARPAPKLPPGADADCFICRVTADTADRENLVVERTAGAVVILNRFPYSNGHLLFAPKRHEGRLDRLSPEELLELQQTMALYVDRLERLLKAEGFNVGLNLGRAAGAGVPGHLHWHLVPRWQGDTNFMPILAGAKVIPQSLDAVWDLLHEASSGAKPSTPGASG